MADQEFESAITDEMRALIGVKGPETISELTTTSVRMFARSVGYVDPAFYDEAVARERGFRSLPAPPGYLGTPIYNPAESDPTFGGRRGGGGFRSPYPLVLNGGTDIEYTGEQICAGDTLTSATALASLNERWSGALGVPMLIQVSETTYTNQNGKVVAISRGTGISYPRPGD
ncbi:MAG: MaoC family dehydratase [Chloroflexi bacterium]|nr:MaoC family dehydratase [Chloroflexota bacterium]MYI05579.1 MaoC family dehydratase [Chloroflexota bacterium]